MNTTNRDLRVFDGLSVVKITGFEPEKVETEDGQLWATDEIDPLGSANWLVAGYGMATDVQAETGILWTDYDGPGWTFAALIDSDEADDLAQFARESGYAVDSIEPVAEPTNFGDGNGTVEICKHRDGWIVLD